MKTPHPLFKNHDRLLSHRATVSFRLVFQPLVHLRGYILYQQSGHTIPPIPFWYDYTIPLILYQFAEDSSAGCGGKRLTAIGSLFGFNPRTRAGCDIGIFRPESNLDVFQSTHPRGVRLLIIGGMKSILCFNPRTRAGCDYYGSVDYAEGIEFQSTHPRGVRLTILLAFDWHICFNPRTRAGCDGSSRSP